LAAFLRDYGTEEQREAAFIKASWPGGFICLCCGQTATYEFKRKQLRYWQCGACRHQTSLRARTVLEHGRLPLTKWYLAIYLVTQSKTNIAALALMRQLGVSRKAAWLLKHKLMEAMAQREAGRPLQGDISVDDAYLGGERTGGGPGRGSSNKVAFVAAVEMRRDVRSECVSIR
jgi:ribosomal protein L37AE/L43A